MKISQNLAKLAVDKVSYLLPDGVFGKGYSYTDDRGIKFWTNISGGLTGDEKTERVVKMSQAKLQTILRTRYGIIVYVIPFSIEKFDFKILVDGKITSSTASFETYELALENGLEFAIKNFDVVDERRTIS